MYDNSGVRLSLIHSLPAVAEANGLSVGPLLSLGGLEPDAFQNRDRIVRRSQIVTAMNGLARRSGDAAIGFKMAQTTDPDQLGPFGRSLMIGRTLGEALTLQRHLLPWLQRGTSISMEILGPTVQWTHRMHGCDPADARFLTEGIATFFVKFVRAATGDEGAPMHVILPHKPGVPVSVYEDTFGCPVSFEKGTDLEIQFDAALLKRRNLLRETTDGRPIGAEDASVPARFDLSNEDLLAGLQRMIEAAALWGRLTLADSALTLGLPPRSLQRRLSRIGTTFEEIVDDWRHRQALTLLSDPSNGTTVVAARLGYADPSHFIRAFRRWQGVSPTDFRLSLARNGN